MHDLIQDLRFALRILRKRPGASAVIVLTLALGIGINAVFFGNYYAMSLRPLPFQQPEELVHLYRADPDVGRRGLGIAAGSYLDWRGQIDDTFVAVGAYASADLSLRADEHPVRVEGVRITADLFPLLGVRPAEGRWITPEEDRPGGAPVAIVSHRIWREHLGADPKAVGRMLHINGKPHEVVGVMPSEFAFPLWHDLWIPLGLDPDGASRGAGPLQMIGRLAPGVDATTAHRRMDALARDEARAFESVPEDLGAEVLPLHDAWMPPVTRIAGLVMQGLAALVLLIVCFNVVHMVLAQAGSRRRELHLRAALGADRLRLTRQALTESLVLTGLGGGLGLLLTLWSGDWIERLSSVPIPYWLSFETAPPVIVFTLISTVVVALGIGWIPTLGERFDHVSDALKSASGAGSGAARSRLRPGLVVAQYAVAVVILVGALLMVRAYRYVAESDQGFQVAERLSLSLALTPHAFDDPETGRAFVERSLERIDALPGVRSASAVSRLHISREGYQSATVETEGGGTAERDRPRVTLQAVSAGYFDTLEIPVIDGRPFRRGEVLEGTPVALVNRGLADRLWPGEHAVGRRLRIAEDGPWLRIVGTTGDLRPVESIAGVGRRPQDQLYLPLGFAPHGGYGYLSRTPSIVISTGAPLQALAPTLRQELADLDPRVAVYHLQPLRKHIEQHYFAQLIWSRMFTGIGMVALLIAALGAYGVSAHGVSRRTREMGIRLALGEAPRTLMGSIVGQGLRQAALGLILGLLLALPLAAAMENLLHGIRTSDPLVVGGVVLLLLGVAVTATVSPARRAAGLDPIQVLRQE